MTASPNRDTPNNANVDGSGTVVVVPVPPKPPLPWSRLGQLFDMVLLIKVTAPTNAIARPQVIVAPAFSVML